MKVPMTLLPVVLGACVAATAPSVPPEEPALRSPSPPAVAAPARFALGPTCEASIRDPEAVLGKRPEYLGFDDAPFPVRIVRPGMAVTMDFNPARLTVETDDEGRITRVHCG